MRHRPRQSVLILLLLPVLLPVPLLPALLDRAATAVEIFASLERRDVGTEKFSVADEYVGV